MGKAIEESGAALRLEGRRFASVRRFLGHPKLIALGCAVVGLLAFAPVLTFGFVYDDQWTIVENAWLERPLLELGSLVASGEAVARRVPDATRPLMVLLHALERRAFGLAPWGYHLVSLALYGLCCALATSVAWALTRKRSIALVAGLFFALSPFHAEPVAAINYREDLLAAVGTLGALLLLIPAPGRPTAEARPRRETWGRALGAGALLLGGLLGKESALSFVPLAVAIAWLVPWVGLSVRKHWRILFTLGAVLVCWLAWRWPLAAGGEDLPLAPDRPLTQLLLRAARFELQALKFAVVPFGYAPDHWRQPDASLSPVVPLLSLLVGAAVLGRVRSIRPLAVGVAIALAAPLGASPLLRPVNEYADRYFFLSVLGGGIAWGWALERLGRVSALRPVRRLLPLACVPLLFVTWPATRLWRDERSLWTAAVAITPQSPRAWGALSRVHRLAGERDAADFTLQRALAADDRYVPALLTQVLNDLAFERLDAARAHLAELETKGLGRAGAFGKARQCAAMVDAVSARRCIER